MTVGREHFKYPRIAPPELQDVETPGAGVAKIARPVASRHRLRQDAQDQHLAGDRSGQRPPNLARFARNRTGDLPFQPILGGAYMCPADPVAHEINESRLKSLFATYPEAEGYFLWFPELYPVCDDDKSRAYTLQERPKFFAEETLHWKAYANGYERNADRVVDSDVGTVELMRSALEARDRINPKAQVGIGAFGRGFVYPLIDKMFPKRRALYRHDFPRHLDPHGSSHGRLRRHGRARAHLDHPLRRRQQHAGHAVQREHVLQGPHVRRRPGKRRGRAHHASEPRARAWSRTRSSWPRAPGNPI